MLINQLLIAHVGTAMLAVATAGLLVRRRVTFCWSFFFYLLAAQVFVRLMMHWPERFFVFTFWSMKETAYFVLMVLVAVEIWLRSFSSLPRARVRVGFLLAGALLATAVAVLTIPTGLDPYDTLVGILEPRQKAGALAVFAIIVTAASWYRVPLHPLHRAILIGCAAYLPLHIAIASFVGFHSGGEWINRLGRMSQVASVATMAWWAWAAWRPLRAPSPIVSRLQPWAHSW